MNMLYEERLILENSFSISQDELRVIGDDPDGPMITVVAAFGADGAVQKGTARWAEYFFLMPPLGRSQRRQVGPQQGSLEHLLPRHDGDR